MIGNVCVKIAGRDAGKVCVVVEDSGKGYVTIDGATRRRKCNLKHLEIIGFVKLKAKASHSEVVKVLKEYGVVERKGKAKPKTSKPKKKRKVKAVKKEVKPKVEKKVKKVKKAKKK